MARKGKIQKKILILLLAGLSLGMSRSPKHHFRVIKQVKKEWQEINKKSLETAIETLYKSKLIDQKDNRIFDIPEKLKKVRDALRYHLKRLGFIELQHSVFVLPFKCRDEIEYLVEFYNVRRFVRYIEAYHIDNELDLKYKFHLL